jgi:hypothetical protein
MGAIKIGLLVYTVVLSQIDFLAGFYGMRSGVMVLFLIQIALCLCLYLADNSLRQRSETVLRQHSMLMLIIVASILFSAVTIIWSNARMYGITKLAVFFVKLMAFWIASPLFVTRGKISWVAFLLISLANIIAVIVVVGNPVYLFSSYGKFDRLGSEISNPIVLGRYFGFVALGCFLIIFYQKMPIVRIAAFSCGMFSVLFALLTGSKGPLLGLTAGVTLIVLLNLLNLYKRNLRQQILVPIIPLVILVYKLLESIGDSEFVAARFTMNDESYDSRKHLSSLAIDLFMGGQIENIVLGSGLGNYGYVLEGNDEAGYPHNLFLELLYETGLLGTALWVTWLFYPLISAIYKKRSMGLVGCNNLTRSKSEIDISEIVGVFFVYFLINSMVSSDLAGNVYCFVGCIAILTAKTKAL